MASLLLEIRSALRSLLSQPAFAVLAVLSLAVGIGANTAIFTIADRTLVRTLPATRPEELFIPLWHGGTEMPAESLMGSISFDDQGRSSSTSFPVPAWRRLQQRGGAVSHLVAFSSIERINAALGDTATTISGHSVSGNYFPEFGVLPAAGRLLQPGDDTPGAAPVAVLSHRFWEQRFGRSPEAVGSAVRLNGIPFTVVGVAPPGFFGTVEIDRAPDIFVTLSHHAILERAPESMGSADYWWIQLLGRTKDKARATAEMTDAFRSWVREARPGVPQVNQLRIELLPGSRGLGDSRSTYRRPILLLWAISAIVFLLACTNVATLHVARMLRRRRELMTRMALGASAGRLLRAEMLQALLLAFAGAAVGVTLAGWAAPLLVRFLPTTGGAPAIDTGLDIRSAGFAAALALLSALAIGLVGRVRSFAEAEFAGHARTTDRRTTMGKALVVLQVALSVSLLGMAALLVRTLQRIENIDLGFDSANLVQLRVDSRTNGYSDERKQLLARHLTEALSRLPGVKSVTLSSHGLLTRQSMMADASRPDEPVRPGARPRYVFINLVDPAFLSTMGIPLERGRNLRPEDRDGSMKVALVNRKAASLLFDTAEPVGRTVTVFGEAEYTVVGVTGDAKYTTVRDDAPPTLYLSIAQHSDRYGTMTFDLRTAVPPTSVIPSALRAVTSVDADLAAFDVATQTDLVEGSTRQERLFTALASAFAAVASFLGALGLYGLMSYLVSSRLRETGVRMALGADARRVFGGVLRESMVLVVLGIIVSVPLVLAGGYLARTVLYETSPHDPLSLGLASLVAVLLGVAASGSPAVRAARADPAALLRSE